MLFPLNEWTQIIWSCYLIYFPLFSDKSELNINGRDCKYDTQSELYGCIILLYSCISYWRTKYDTLVCCGCVYLKGRGWHCHQSIEKAQSCTNMTAQFERKHAHLLIKYRCHYLTMAPFFCHVCGPFLGWTSVKVPVRIPHTEPVVCGWFSRSNSMWNNTEGSSAVRSSHGKNFVRYFFLENYSFFKVPETSPEFSSGPLAIEEKALFPLPTGSVVWLLRRCTLAMNPRRCHSFPIHPVPMSCV